MSHREANPDDCFEWAPEFVEEDNRRFRTHNPVSKEQMRNKHEVMFPAHMVHGRSVLDLGSCMGSTGHWCLSHGATHYTGVEVQKEYTDFAATLLKKYHPGQCDVVTMSIEDFLATNTRTYDIVALLGVTYSFVDYYSILQSVADIAKEQLIFENLYPLKVDADSKFCGVKFVDNQTINLGSENGSLSGRGSRISPRGMLFLMLDFSFSCPDGLLYPQPITSSLDVYNTHDGIKPLRYLMRFVRTSAQSVSLSEDLQTQQTGEKKTWGEGFQDDKKAHL